MRTIASFAAVVTLLASAGTARAQGPAYSQDRVRHLDLEVEPLSYAFGGAGGHVAYQRGNWKYEVEAFGLEIPASLHGNDRFEASLLGAELHFEHYFGEDPGGFYVGPEVGVVQLDVTHQASGTSTQKTRYSVGLRGGYQWYTGLGNLYVSPVVGVSYTLNGDPVRVGGDTFESAPIGPWGTVGLGWSFGR
jgi:hypothetical protein